MRIVELEVERHDERGAGRVVGSHGLDDREVLEGQALLDGTASDAATLFGEPAIPSPNTTPSPLGEQCLYQNKNRTTDRPYWLLQVHHYTQAGVFDSRHIVHKTYTNLSGIGDAAFVSPDVIGTGWEVEVKKGSDVYTFDLNASSFGGPKPTVSKDALVALVRSKLA